jgi:hypothetical protein
MPDLKPRHVVDAVDAFGAFVLLIATLLLVAAVGAGCSSSLPAACSAATCSGCCTADGQCEAGTAGTACGAAGSTCAVCTDTQACSNAICIQVDAGTPVVDAGCPGCAPDAGPADAGSGLVLSVDNFDAWCTVTVNGAPLTLAGTYTFDAGTVVNLDAVANTGFVFAYWLGTDGANSGNGEEDPNRTTTVTMDANMNVLACCNNPGEGLLCPTP